MHRLPYSARMIVGKPLHRLASFRPCHSNPHRRASTICSSRRQHCLADLQHRPRPCLSHTTSISSQQRRGIRVVPVGKTKHIRRTRFNNHPKLPVLGATPAAAYERRLAADSLPLRTGVLAVKKGMTAVYVDASGIRLVDGSDESAAEQAVTETIGKPMPGGRRIPATVLQMDRVQVIANKTREKHGYYAVVIGEGWRQPKRIGKAMLGVFANARTGEILPPWSRTKLKSPPAVEEPETDPSAEDTTGPKQGHIGLPPKREMREFKVRDANGLLPIGTFISPSWFRVGQFVDARGTARGMGFAGGMKRHGFKGQPASHGVSLTHRSMGSAGGGQGSGSRVHPGKRMAGNMGGQRHTVQNLKVLMVDAKNGLVVVTGAVSGRKGDLVMLSDAVKKPWPELD